MNIDISDKLAEAFAFGLGVGSGLVLTYFTVMGIFLGIAFAMDQWEMRRAQTVQQEKP